MPWIPIIQLAELTGTSARTVKKRCESLETRKGAKGAILLDSRQALPLIYQLGDTGQPCNPAAEKARLDRLRADQIEQKMAEDRGELIRIDQAARIVDKMILDCRQRLLAIPTKAAPLVMGCKTLPAARDVLKKAVHEALYDLTQIDPARFVGKDRIQPGIDPAGRQA